MNRKSLLTLAAVAATGVAFAATESATTLCRIAVTTTTQETMIGLPLVDVGGSTTVNVTNFVMTTGLPDDTTLQYRSDGGWIGWTLQSSKWEAVKLENDTYPTSELARGKGVLLTLPSQPAESQTFYLYGQFVSDEIATQAPSAGYSLVGNAATTPVTAATLAKNCGITPASGDQIIVPVKATWTVGETSVTMQSQKVYKFVDPSWDGEFTIPAGQGFWYRKAAN